MPIGITQTPDVQKAKTFAQNSSPKDFAESIFDILGRENLEKQIKRDDWYYKTDETIRKYQQRADKNDNLIDLPDKTKEIHLDKSTDKKVVELEQKMKELGVDMTFEDDLQLAKLVHEDCEYLKSLGYDLPEHMILITPEKLCLGGFIYADGKFPVFISKNIVRAECEGNSYNPYVDYNSAKLKDGAVFHEVAHYLHVKSGFDTREGKKIYSRIFGMMNSASMDKILREVSYYSIAGSDDGTEFVAEVFAGIMSGKKYSPAVMKIYRAFNGPEIKK